MEKELFNSENHSQEIGKDSVKPETEPILTDVQFVPIPPMIYKKILDIQEGIPTILKGREFKNAQGKIIYKFRGIDDLYNAVNPLFKKHRVFMIPEVLSREGSERIASSGSVLFYEKLEVKYKIMAEDGSSIETVIIGIGMDSGDKAANKAMSVAQKYALIQIFSIPTDEKNDPENDAHEVTNEDFLDIMKLLDKCMNIPDLEILWKSLESDQQKNKMIFSVFAKHKAKLKGAKK